MMSFTTTKLGLLFLSASAVLAVPVTQPIVARATGNKRGVCYNDPNLTNLFSSSAVTFAYDWDQVPGGTILSSLEYIPMLWNSADSRTSSWNTNAAAGLSAGATHLLGFNEPDLDTQANMTVADAISTWQTYMDPFAAQATLVSPAVTNGASPMGLAWLSDFITNCSGCTINAIALHWYDSATNIDYFKNYISGAYQQFNMPIWLTEFGASGSDDEVNTFLQTVLPWLDEQDYIVRYAYFWAADGSLVSSDGTSLSEYGSTYVNN